LLRELTVEEQQIVQKSVYGKGPLNEVLAKVGTDSVRRESMHRLQPGKWLNDEIIHYFFKMLAIRDEKMSQADPSRKRSHFFKSFFVTKQLNEGHDDPNMEGKYEYKNVERWSRFAPGGDLFNLDKIFFPINTNRSHWICAVVFFKEKRIQMYDSMGAGGMHYLKHIFRYLQDEHRAKKGCPMPDLDEWTLVPCTRDTPSQQNGFDCGVYLCMFLDFLSMDCPLVFSQEHINRCRERIALSIMKGCAVM
jgi:sentrin-specific protease 1